MAALPMDLDADFIDDGKQADDGDDAEAAAAALSRKRKLGAPSSSSSSASSASPPPPPVSAAGEQPFIEKYRPQVLADVVGNDDIVNRLRVIAQHGNMPNLIVAGPPGTGKTTSIHCLAREMLGGAYKQAVLEMNASDARGIDVVRNEIKQFAQKKVTLPPGRQKIVILDEADSLTQGAQQALRRTMELYSNTTRFALACNVSSKIIEPIQSRCAILRYTRLSDAEILKRMLEVIELEGISTYTSDGLEALIFTAQGDMRHALNNLQATWASLEHVTQQNVLKVVDQPHPLLVAGLIEDCVQGDLTSAMMKMRALHDDGYAPIDIIGTVFRVAKTMPMEEKHKLHVIKEVGFTHMRIADGCDSLLQLDGLLARLCRGRAQ